MQYVKILVYVYIPEELAFCDTWIFCVEIPHLPRAVENSTPTLHYWYLTTPSEEVSDDDSKQILQAVDMLWLLPSETFCGHYYILVYRVSITSR